MKDKILERIDMVKKFMEWIRTSDTLDTKLGEWISGKISSEELFTYWHKNIYKIKDKDK
jgi:hypothetical protein